EKDKKEMDMAEKEEDKGFSVKDRRFFSETGESRPAEEKTAAGGGEEKEETPGREEPKKEKAGKPDGEKPKEAQKEYAYPEVNFSYFVLSLHTSALFHFGDFQDPASGETEKNIGAAKQTIDILAMLKEKTAGNLSENERHLLDSVLFELRMRFVKESGRS
ncbi:MAG TPA: DUF1844 domain-containing protein, partial [Syntrophales bacterium]|nr:DUF1844 domain-containing protein [Syntrophales bacterium]